MKKYLLLSFIAFTLNVPLLSQHHFPKDSAEWKVYYVFTQGPVKHRHFVRHSYMHDTLIAGRQYMQVTSSQGVNFTGVTHIREVDSTQKVYALWSDGPSLSEYLLYDFSKSVGDTVIITSPYGIPDTVAWYVFDEGQVTIGSQQRRFMDLAFVGINPFQDGDSIYMDRWIEGIGSVRGLFAPMLDNGYIGIGEYLRYHLVCFADKGEGIQYEPELLQDPTFYYSRLYAHYDAISDCSTVPWYNMSVKETALEPPQIKVYPNPFGEKLHIENPVSDPCSFSLIAADGRKVTQGRLEEYEKRILETDHLPKGLYVLKTEMESQVVSTRVFCR